MSRKSVFAVILGFIAMPMTVQGQVVKEGTPAEEAAKVKQIMKTLGGGPDTWWVVHTYHKAYSTKVTGPDGAPGGNAHMRAHVAIMGTETAAQAIVAFANEHSWRINHGGYSVSWEKFKSEEEAQRRVALSKQLDAQQGFK